MTTPEQGVAAIAEWSTEHIHDGCSVTWDAEARAGYAHTNPNPDAFAPTTKQVAPGVLVDVDPSGYVRGVETIGHEVGIGDLLAVLRHCRFAGWGSGSYGDDR